MVARRVCPGEYELNVRNAYDRDATLITIIDNRGGHTRYCTYTISNLELRVYAGDDLKLVDRIHQIIKQLVHQMEAQCTAHEDCRETYELGVECKRDTERRKHEAEVQARYEETMTWLSR